MKTKLCRACGRKLPLNAFSVDNHMHDHLSCYCKECVNSKASYRKMLAVTAIKLGRNPKLVKFSDDELMQELSARLNYKLTY